MDQSTIRSKYGWLSSTASKSFNSLLHSDFVVQAAKMQMQISGRGGGVTRQQIHMASVTCHNCRGRPEMYSGPFRSRPHQIPPNINAPTNETPNPPITIHINVAVMQTRVYAARGILPCVTIHVARGMVRCFRNSFFSRPLFL